MTDSRPATAVACSCGRFACHPANHLCGDGPAHAAPDAQEGNMTTATIEVEVAVEGTPRRIVLFTIAVLLPADFNDADIANIVPVSVKVDGHQDYVLTDLIQTGVQEARLAMAP